MMALGASLMVIVCLEVSVQPLLPFTASHTLYLPALYLWAGFSVVELVASPKLQLNEVILPLVELLLSVNLTESGEHPPVKVKEAVGFADTTTSCSMESLQPLLVVATIHVL
jgi:hypothetical protein